MKNRSNPFVLSLVLLLLPCNSSAGDRNPLDRLEYLVGGLWRGEGRWHDGKPFKAEIGYRWGLGRQVLRADVFVWDGGWRSQKYEEYFFWDPIQGKVVFRQAERAGGSGQGEVRFEENALILEVMAFGYFEGRHRSRLQRLAADRDRWTVWAPEGGQEEEWVELIDVTFERKPQVSGEDPPPAGKSFTDRWIDHQVLVKGSTQQVFELWTSEAGVNRFFGTESVIELKKGGSYEIYFLPRTHPETIPNSTRGAHLLDFEKGRRLTFEWMAPPFAAELNTQPLPTWVDVTIDPAERLPGHSVVRVRHYGFDRGPLWDQLYEYFTTAWSGVLFRLDRILAG